MAPSATKAATEMLLLKAMKGTWQLPMASYGNPENMGPIAWPAICAGSVTPILNATADWMPPQMDALADVPVRPSPRNILTMQAGSEWGPSWRGADRISPSA